MTERLWVGNDGKYTVYASYVCLFQDKKVKLRKPNGALVAVPLSLLCNDDITYITTQSKSPTEDSTSTHSPVKKSFKSSPESLSFEAIPSIIQHMSTTESFQMIPKRSLSTITDPFKRHNNFLANLPARILIKIAALLDVHSRLVLSTVSNRCRQIVLKPKVWQTLFFLSSDHYRINDRFIYQLVVFLQSKCTDLHKSINNVILDGTIISAKTVVFLIQNLENLIMLSLRSCWHVMTNELAVSLTNMQPVATSIAQVALGKVLHRGPVSPSLDSKSFGQDVWHMTTALNRLANRNVYVDVALCSNCQTGATSHEFYCSCCGYLPLKKCITCAPKCDRCGVQTCGLKTCLDPKLKVQLTRCGRCEQLLSLCNNENSPACQEARKPCSQCHRLYHVQCSTSKGTYKSNQCSKCGTPSCPHCDLVSCAGGCHGQWCKKCLPSLGHCKCVVIQGTHLRKRYICMKCQTACSHCNSTHFCKRCIKVHFEKCKIPI